MQFLVEEKRLDLFLVSFFLLGIYQGKKEACTIV